MTESESQPFPEIKPQVPEVTLQSLLTNNPDTGHAAVENPRLVRFLKSIEKTQPTIPTAGFWEGRLSKLSDMFDSDEEKILPEDEIGIIADILRHEHEKSSQAYSTTQELTISGLGKAIQESGFREGSTYDVFVNAELLQQPISLQVDTFPPEWFKKLDSEGQHLIRARIRLANASFIKRRFGDIDGERTKQNDYLSLTEKELGLIWKMPGVKECLYRYTEDFLEKDDSAEEGVFFWTLKAKNKEEAEQLTSFEAYQIALAQEFEEKGVVSDDLEAKSAVAVSWNFLFCCNAMESADTKRIINPSGVYGEQVRALMHPLVKAIGKYGIKPDEKPEQLAVGTEEGWGGQLGDWIANRLEAGDYEFRQKLRERKVKPYPERMLASLPELAEVKVVGIDEKISMAQAFSEKREIQFPSTESDLFGGYLDTWDSAFKAYNYATGKVPLESGKNNREWARTLADTIAKLRSKSIGKHHVLEPYYRNREFILWTIANSVGLRLHTSNLILSLPVSSDAYNVEVRNIVDYPRLVESLEDRRWIKKQFHALGAFAKWDRTRISHQITREATKRQKQ